MLFFQSEGIIKKLNILLGFQRYAFAALGGYFVGAGNMLYRLTDTHPLGASLEGECIWGRKEAGLKTTQCAEVMTTTPRVVIMLRHPDNRNLHFHYDDTFEGLPVMVEKGPLIREYLADLKRTICLALDQYPRVLAFRVNLRLPCDIELDDYIDSNEVISRFFASFKSKVKHHREIAARRYQHAHSCKVRYVWAREQGWRGRPHYHLLILLNRDAFYTVGKIASDRANMFSRLNEAWASALGDASRSSCRTGRDSR
ncbi:Protein of unknown function [Pseudomonas marginalis]|nr:Protein of unknown function [Pseudomonas marginalis]